MTASNPLTHIKLRHPVHFFAVGFGAGLMKSAPGTWGTLVGLGWGVLLLQWLPPISLLILTALFFVVGCYLCQKKPPMIWAYMITALSYGTKSSAFY